MNSLGTMSPWVDSHAATQLSAGSVVSNIVIPIVIGARRPVQL